MTAARWTLQRGAGPVPEFSSPRPVTRGESTPSGPSGPQLCKIDWLNATFPGPSMSVVGFVEFLSKIFGRELSAKQEGGLLGFKTRHKIFAHLDDGAKAEIGSVAMGGKDQNGRWLLQIPGQGCQLVRDWESLHEFLEGLDAIITRLDMALDFLQGEKTVDHALDMAEAGLFTNGGRTPKIKTDGQWHGKNTDGRTVYVGRAKNGKMLRCYEKGKQLGDEASEWTRYEVQLGNRDREIPLEAMLKPDQYFAGAYPALQALLDEMPKRIPTTRTQTQIGLGHIMHHLKRSYGKAIHQAIQSAGVSHADLVEEVRVIGVPRRLTPAGVQSGLAWPELQAQMRKYENA